MATPTTLLRTVVNGAAVGGRAETFTGTALLATVQRIVGVPILPRVSASATSMDNCPVAVARQDITSAARAAFGI